MREGWADVLCAALIGVGASGVGLAVNALSPRPVPLLSAGPGALPERQPRISAAELKSVWAEGRAVVLLDVRRGRADGSAARAVHVPADRFHEIWAQGALAGSLRAAKEVVVMCEGGACSTGDRVARLLRDLGFGEVRVLEGGWPSYREAGLP